MAKKKKRVRRPAAKRLPELTGVEGAIRYVEDDPEDAFCGEAQTAIVRLLKILHGKESYRAGAKPRPGEIWHLYGRKVRIFKDCDGNLCAMDVTTCSDIGKGEDQLIGEAKKATSALLEEAKN